MAAWEDQLRFFQVRMWEPENLTGSAGDAEFSLGSGIVEIIARIVFILILASIPAVGYWSIWITAILSSIVAAALCVWRFRGGKWMKKSVV